MDVLVRARFPLARCRCHGMCFDSNGCLLVVTPKEYDVLRATPGLEVTPRPPVRVPHPDLLDFWARLDLRAWEKAHA